MNKPTLNLPSDYLSVYDFVRLLDAKGVKEGQSFNVSFKYKKRRKLKSVKLVNVSFGCNCECCESYQWVTFEKNGRQYEYDNHLGNFNAGQLGHDLMKAKV
jgi:hypothetical protein